MNANEMYEMVKSQKLTEEILQQTLEWCMEHSSSIDFNNESEKKLYQYAMLYLFRLKIGHLNEEEAKLVITYLAREQLHFQKLDGLNKDVNITILNEEEYKEQHGEDSHAICVSNDDAFDIVYSPSVVQNLMSNDPTEFLRGIRTIYHEFTHTIQNQIIKAGVNKDDPTSYNDKAYKMAAESLARKLYADFYNENYAHLFKENQAELFGLKQAILIIKRFNKDLYSLFDEKAIEVEETRLRELMKESTIKIKGKEMPHNRGLHAICDELIKNHPEVLDDYPILKIGYTNDGNRKSLTELLQEKQAMISVGYDKEKIDKLYLFILNNRTILNLAEDVQELYLYIVETKGEDRMAYDALYHRFDRGNVPDEKRMQILNMIESSVAKEKKEKVA